MQYRDTPSGDSKGNCGVVDDSNVLGEYAAAASRTWD